MAANKRLMGAIRSMGLGAFKLIGHWKECPEGQKDCPDEERIPVKEASFGVVGVSKEAFTKLLRKYRQEAGVFLGPETDGKAILIEIGKPDMRIGSFSPGRISDVWSRIRGSTFVFEGFEMLPHSWGEAMIRKVTDLRASALR